MRDRRGDRGALSGVGALAVALAGPGRPALAQDGPQPPAARPATLPDALDAIGRAGGLNVLLDRRAFPALGPAPVLPADVPPREAVDRIASALEAEVEVLAGGVLVLTQAPRVTIQFTGADVRTVLELLAAYAGKQVLVAGDVQGRVDTDLVDVPWREALDTFAKEVGVHAAVAPDLVLVTGRPVPPEALAELDWRPPGEAARRVTLALEGGLEAACAELARQAEVRLTTEAGDDPPLGGTLRDLVWSDAVRVLAWLTGRRATTVDGVVRLEVPSPAHLHATRCPAAAFDALLAACAGVRLIAERPREGEVTLGLAGVEPLEALRVVALLREERLERSEEQVTLRAAPWPALGGLGAPAAPPTPAAGGDEAGSTEAAEGSGPAGHSREELAERLEAILGPLERAAESGDVVRVVGSFTDLRRFTDEHGRRGVALVQARLPELRRRLGGYGEVLLSLELQVSLVAGNGHLRAMADAIHADRFADALAEHAELEALADRMSAMGRAVFARNAAALRERGASLAARARHLQRLSALPVVLSAVASFGGDPDRPGAAVINGHVIRVGEPVRDAAGAPIRGLTLRAVLPSTVTLDSEGEEWIRELP